MIQIFTLASMYAGTRLMNKGGRSLTNEYETVPLEINMNPFLYKLLPLLTSIHPNSLKIKKEMTGYDTNLFLAYERAQIMSGRSFTNDQLFLASFPIKMI